MEQRTFTDTDGVEIATRWWLVEDPKALVLISHGASEHSGRYGRFAEALNRAGFAAVALDHRGHGLTSPSSGSGVIGPGGGAALVADLHRLRADAVAEVGASVPVVLFGHSLGSLIGLTYLVAHSDGLAGGVLCGFPVDPAGVADLGAMLAGIGEAGMRDESAAALLADFNSAFEPARTPFDWLSRDPAEVDAYVADPLCGAEHPLRFGYYMDLFDTVAPAVEQLGSIVCPCLVIAGDQDPAAAMGANATAVANALNGAGVSTDLRLYEGARHELLNETNRDEVTVDVIAWFDSRLA